MSIGRRRLIVTQAQLVWADRGPPAFERFIQSGSFGDDETTAEPYDQAIVKAIVESGRLI